MISVEIAYLCGSVLFIAGALELIRVNRGSRPFRIAAWLAAFGFWMLGARFWYMANVGDLVRPHIFGTGAIGAIALARIIACAESIKARL